MYDLKDKSAISRNCLLFMYMKVERVCLANQACELTYYWLAPISYSLHMTQSSLVSSFPECSISTVGGETLVAVVGRA